MSNLSLIREILISKNTNFTFKLDYNDTLLAQGKFFYGESFTAKEEISYEPYRLPLAFIVPLLCMYGIAIFVSLGGNVVVVYTICTVKVLRTVTNFFLASLSVSDILMTIVCIPSTILSNIIFHHWVLGPVMCPIVQYVQLVVVLQRAFSMVAITCDRHFVISRPLKKRMNKTRARILVLILWISAAIIALPTAIHSKIMFLQYEPGSKGLCIELWDNHRLRYIYSIIIMLLQYFLPSLIMMCTYLHIGYMIWIKKPPGEANRERDKRIASSKRKSLKMLFVVVAVYAITWLPLHVLTIIGDLNPSLFNHMYAHILWLIFHWLAFSNSGINPIIYCWMNQTFQAKFRFIWYRIICNRKKALEMRRIPTDLKRCHSAASPNCSQKSKNVSSVRKDPSQFLEIPSKTQQTSLSSMESDKSSMELRTFVNQK